jgi:hypothetical protein
MHLDASCVAPDRGRLAAVQTSPHRRPLLAPRQSQFNPGNEKSNEIRLVRIGLQADCRTGAAKGDAEQCMLGRVADRPTVADIDRSDTPADATRPLQIADQYLVEFGVQLHQFPPCTHPFIARDCRAALTMSETSVHQIDHGGTVRPPPEIDTNTSKIQKFVQPRPIGGALHHSSIIEHFRRQQRAPLGFSRIVYSRNFLNLY